MCDNLAASCGILPGERGLAGIILALWDFPGYEFLIKTITYKRYGVLFGTEIREISPDIQMKQMIMVSRKGQ